MVYNKLGVTNSQHAPMQGPREIDQKYASCMDNIRNSMYANSFFSSFCSSYSITLNSNPISGEFFSISGDQTRFIDLFGYDFLKYNIDPLLTNITKNLLVFGQAFVEHCETGKRFSWMKSE